MWLEIDPAKGWVECGYCDRRFVLKAGATDGSLRWKALIRKPQPAPSGRAITCSLIDGSGYIFRAYHALPPLTRKSDGLPVGAVAGFCNMVWKLLDDVKGADAPTHVAVIFDASARTFRNELYPDYKAQRPPSRPTTCARSSA